VYRHPRTPRKGNRSAGEGRLYLSPVDSSLKGVRALAASDHQVASPHLPANMTVCLFDNPRLSQEALRALQWRFHRDASTAAEE
jgi:hypothetical protein